MFGDPYDTILIVLGLIYLAILVLSFLGGQIRRIRRLCQNNLVEKYGKNSWAVITGASDGIGKGFAEQLAKYGFNIVLIARNQTKLEGVAEELKKLNSAIQTKIVVADFNRGSELRFYDEIYLQIRDLDISILVNNVGVDLCEHFHEVPEERFIQMFNLNIFPIVILTKKLINLLRMRKPRSAIVNVSSCASLVEMPYLGTYGATKAFDDHFSRSLQIEYPELDIISLRPGYVKTNMTFNKDIGFDTISATDCAEGTLRDLGRYDTTSAHWKHDLLGWSSTLLPKFIADPVTKMIIKQEMKRRHEEEKKIEKKE